MHLVSIDPGTAAAQATWNRLANNQRAAWLRAALRVRGQTQTDLAKIVDMTPQAVSDWVNGKVEIDWSRRMAILVALDLPQTWEPSTPLPSATPNVKRIRTARGA